MIEPTVTWYFPSNWTADQILEWARLRNWVLSKSDLTLYRGWNGRQFWFTLAWPLWIYDHVACSKCGKDYWALEPKRI